MIRVLCILFLHMVASSAAASDESTDPIARFEVEDGWINVHIEKDGKPIPDGRMTVLIGTKVWAEGETGTEGLGTFPKPREGHCQVTIAFGADPAAAPIPLSFLEDGSVSPKVVAIQGATPPCCKTPILSPNSSASPTTGEERLGSHTSTIRWVVGGTLIATAVVLIWLGLRSRRMVIHAPTTEGLQ